MKSIGFIGLGRMGMPMCSRLAGAGYQVAAGDARPTLAAEARQAGASWKGAPAAAAANADIVMTMLPGPREVSDVMVGSAGVLAAMPATAIWVDMSTNSPTAVRELAAAAAACGVAALDAPVGGGVEAAKFGTLQLFVGGDHEVLEKVRPALDVLARTITHVGGSGAGCTVKLLVNLLWFSQAVSVGEALLLARRVGLDLEVLRSALAGSAASSTFLDQDFDRLLDGDYRTTFGLDRVCEELAGITALAHDLQVPSELADLVERTYRRALRRYGLVDGELMAVALLEDEAGLQLRRGSC
jgi:3-hydroxyisobutyrate dehydrogenase